jgi:hypothetical protein
MADSKLQAQVLDLFPSTKQLEAAHLAALKFTGIEELKAAGPDSNYINWKFVVGIHLRLTKVIYVLTPMSDNMRPSSWAQDNTAVCAVITRTVHSSNYCYLRDFEDNAAGMWAALRAVNQDSSSGGHMYVLAL